MTLSLLQITLLIFASTLVAFAGFLMLQYSWRSRFHLAKERCDLIDFSVNLIQASATQAIHCLESLPPQCESEVELLDADVKKLDQLAARLMLIDDSTSVDAIRKISLSLKRASKHCKTRESINEDPLLEKFKLYLEQRKLHSLSVLSKQYQQALTTL